MLSDKMWKFEPDLGPELAGRATYGPHVTGAERHVRALMVNRALHGRW